MKTFFLLFIAIFVIQNWAMPQTKITGTVSDDKGIPLPGVNIQVKGSYDGTTSSHQGVYSFETQASGSQVILFQLMGFKSRELAVEFDRDTIEIGDTRLIEQISEMNAVTISAGSMEASDEKKSVIMRSMDIVTTPSANGDIVGAFQTLPGTSTVGNDGRLFVRGGDASEVGIYVDCMRVGNAYGTTAGNVPTRTRFNPNLFKGTFFSTGGYSAEYGQALSSALAMNTKDLSIRSQGDLSIMTIGGGYSHALASDTKSITLSANYFDLKPYQALIKQNFDWERAPYGWDIELAAQGKLKNGGLLKILARTESGAMELWQPEPGNSDRGVQIRLRNKYSYAQSNWRNSYTNGWSLFGGVSFSHNLDNLGVDGTQLDRTNGLLHLKTTAVKDFSDRVSMKIGTEYFMQVYAEKLIDENLVREFNETEMYLFTEWDWYLSKQLVVRAGLRAGMSQLAHETWMDPRMSIAYRVSDHGQFSLAGGKFHQLPLENYRVLNTNLTNSSADHLIINYLYQREGITFRAESFYKSYHRLVTFEGHPRQPKDLVNSGSGYARGMDVFFRDRKSFRYTDYWITYSYVDSRRIFDQFKTKVQPGYAPRHNFSIVAKRFISTLKSQLGLSFSLNDGYTYSNPNESGEMNSRTKSYQNLSMSWSYLPKPNLIIHLAVNNVLGRENIFGYAYASNPNEQGRFESLPSGQAAPRFIFLGVFLTLSKDKNANQLNNL